MSELKTLQQAALTLLARREHSHLELQRKLARKTQNTATLQQVLQDLVQQNLQSDARFATSYVRYRQQAGYGPLRIRQELCERGITDIIVAECFRNEDEAWYVLAKQVKQKKFGTHSPENIKAKAKQIRFLQYRGFTHDQIKEAIGT